MDLYGWDTGYATTIAEVNKALADPQAVLRSFAVTEQGMTVQGSFGPWSIVAGGAGELLHLQTAITSGTITGGGAPNADLAGLAVLLEINLQFLPSKLPSQQDLGFSFKRVGKPGQPSAPGVVTPLRVLDPDKKLSFLQEAVLGAAVAQCLVDKASAISFAFASIGVAPPAATAKAPTGASFSYSEEGWTLQAVAGAWSTLPGGADPIVHVQLALTAGSLAHGSEPKPDLAGLALALELDLAHAGAGARAPPANVVTTLSVDDPQNKLSVIHRAALGALVAHCPEVQASAIALAYASVKRAPPTPADSWLTPVSCGYAYFQTGAGDGYLVILGATDARDTSRLSRQIDPELVTGAGSGFFAISDALFLQHVIQPVLPSVYPGTDATYFRYDAAHKCIDATKPIGVGGVKSGAITYYPKITALSIAVSGGNVVASASGNCDLGIGMSMTFSVTSTSASSFDTAKAELSLAKDPNPKESHDSHIPWYDYLMGAIPDIIMAIVVPVVADGIASGLSSAVKGMSFAKAGPQSVHWAGMKSFSISGGQLNSAFRLWGQLN